MIEDKKMIYYYSSDEEEQEIKSALEGARETPSGKVRGGDVLRMILLSWARNGGKI